MSVDRSLPVFAWGVFFDGKLGVYDERTPTFWKRKDAKAFARREFPDRTFTIEKVLMSPGDAALVPDAYR